MARILSENGLEDPDFNPTIAGMTDLETDPKAVREKKSGSEDRGRSASGAAGGEAFARGDAKAAAVRSPLPSDAEPIRDPRMRLDLLRDIFIAPSRAYPAVLETRSWLPAYLLVVAGGLTGLALSAPALSHVALVTQPTGHISAQDVASGTQTFLANSALFQLFAPLAQWGLTAMALATVARFKSQNVPYAAFFALAAVCSLPQALGNVIDGIGVRLHGPIFPSLKALAVAVPDNLAVFASPANDREVVFLSSFGIFEAWSTILLAFGFVAFAKVRPSTALGVVFALELIFAFVLNAP